MSLEFLLPNGDVAEYQWGSLLAKFSASAPVDRKTMIETLRRARWETNPVFREYIAFQHEAVHYLQDALTGIGHWDCLVRREYHTKLLTLARTLSYKNMPSVTTECYPLGTDDAVSMLQDMIDNLLFLPANKISAARRNKLSESLSEMPGIEHSGEAPIEDALLISHLLEGEAVATVAIDMISILPSLSPMQAEIAMMHQSLFVPFYMPDPYAKTIFVVLSSIEKTFGINPDDGSAATLSGMRAMCWHLYLFLADLACAHPSPRLLAEGQLAMSDYEPGLKLMRLLKAFLDLGVQETQEVLELVVVAQHYERAEAIILGNSQYPYLSKEQIYSDWLDVFESLMKEDDDRLLKLRYKSCKYRLAYPNMVINKSPANLIYSKIPFFFLTPAGLESNGFDSDYLEYDEWKILAADLMRNRRDLALVDFFFGTGRYVCPLAETHACSSETPSCLSGIARTSQFPASPGCSVRTGLFQAGWFLADPA